MPSQSARTCLGLALPGTRKYSTSSKTKSNIVNIKKINNLKLNNNMFVSSVVYNNAEEYKYLILADTATQKKSRNLSMNPFRVI